MDGAMHSSTALMDSDKRAKWESGSTSHGIGVRRARYLRSMSRTAGSASLATSHAGDFLVCHLGPRT
eukprot:1174404-Alexandrium_andersonii.AAC.1